jgi:nicotinamidase-related amidase
MSAHEDPYPYDAVAEVLGVANLHQQLAKEIRMTQPNIAPEPSVTPPPGMSTHPDIHPFSYTASDEALANMRRRIAATIWPEKETVADSSQGVPLATMRELARYWASDYDWRKVEARLHALPQFVTEIDGLDIHFIHVQSRRPDALPLIVNHGWPGSVIEQLKIIDPLTNPTAHGVQRVIVIGLLANTCIDSTVRFAAELGYEVTLVKDAIGSRSWDEMKATLEVNAPNYARTIASTDELLAAFQKMTD